MVFSTKQFNSSKARKKQKQNLSQFNQLQSLLAFCTKKQCQIVQKLAQDRIEFLDFKAGSATRNIPEKNILVGRAGISTTEGLAIKSPSGIAYTIGSKEFKEVDSALQTLLTKAIAKWNTDFVKNPNSSDAILAKATYIGENDYLRFYNGVLLKPKKSEKKFMKRIEQMIASAVKNGFETAPIEQLKEHYTANSKIAEILVPKKESALKMEKEVNIIKPPQKEINESKKLTASNFK